jgi:hypothetical protein
MGNTRQATTKIARSGVGKGSETEFVDEMLQVRKAGSQGGGVVELIDMTIGHKSLPVEIGVRT